MPAFFCLFTCVLILGAGIVSIAAGAIVYLLSRREESRLSSAIVIAVVAFLVIVCGVVALIALLTLKSEAPWSNPAAGFQDSELVGTWEARYGEGDVDRLILRADGTFRQIYQDGSEEGYVYETPWNEWWVERCEDGRVLLHMKGARYYLAGIKIAEEDGMLLGRSESYPQAFHDPFADEPVYMVKELILNVRSDASGELLLHHMWVGSDRGFALIGGEKETFHRIETP